LLTAFLLTSQSAQAGSLRFCDRAKMLEISQQDKLLRFSEVIKTELQKSGQRLALVSRSGLDLSKFNTRYSHAGISLVASQNSPWSIRQLYYACDEDKPKIFDQGLAGFVMGTDSPSLGYISVVFLPEEVARPLELAVLENARSLALLNTRYSANAFAFAQKYQNCNQWVIEMIATSLGALGAVGDVSRHPNPRLQAQQWLKSNGFLPSMMEVSSKILMWIGAFIPLIHSDDHPSEDVEQQRYQVTMPAAIEAFLFSRYPQAERIEFCHNEQHIVIHRGLTPVAEGCMPSENDTVLEFK
jgi:hypothetical protein